MQLATEQARATIDEHGGRLSSFVVDGLELMVTEGEKPTRWGSFPMIPWCGRLPFGRLDFAGATHEFPITSPPHANHGRTHLQDWRPVEPGTLRTELRAPWPFGGHAIQRFELVGTTLTVTAEVHALDRPMPAMIGWHPWFRRVLDRGEPAAVAFEATHIYRTDDQQIPTGDLDPVPPGPWDECFVGLDRPPTITWAGAGRLTIRSDLDHWVIYTKPEHALCVEPQSGPPNQFHLGPQIVVPGEPLVGSMVLEWSTA